MAERHFLHVAFRFGGKRKTTELEPIFDKAFDWLRYTPTCWIVWTSRSPGQWYQRLKPHLGSDDYVLVVRIDPEQRAGFLPAWAWKWIRKDR